MTCRYRSDMAQQMRMLVELGQAAEPAGAEPVMYSEMGWQHQHGGYASRLEAAVIVQGMSGKGNSIDSAATEQPFGHIKASSAEAGSWRRLRTSSATSRSMSSSETHAGGRGVPSQALVA